jgi:hypothetical protein
VRVDAILVNMNDDFQALYWRRRRPSIAPERLLRASLIRDVLHKLALGTERASRQIKISAPARSATCSEAAFARHRSTGRSGPHARICLRLPRITPPGPANVNGKLVSNSRPRVFALPLLIGVWTQCVPINRMSSVIVIDITEVRADAKHRILAPIVRRPLVRGTESGVLVPDNNAIEQAIRPIAVGRSHYLFAGSARGGHAAATMCALIGTAKLNGSIPTCGSRTCWSVCHRIRLTGSPSWRGH